MVRLEGHDHGRAAGFFGVRLRFLDQRLVASVHAVEDADSQVDRTAERLQFSQIVEDLHEVYTPRSRETSGKLMIRALI